MGPGLGGIGLVAAAVITWSLAVAQASPTVALQDTPPGTHVFLAPNGSDGNPCTQSSPCVSFARAYQVAKSGEVVCVASGSYGAQTIPYVAGRSIPNTVFQSCDGTATVLAITMGADNSRNQPCCVTFKDLNITGSSMFKAVFIYWGNTQTSSSAHDITFDNNRIAVGQPTRGPVFEAFDTQRLTIKNSTIGPACCGNDSNGIAAGSPVGIRLGVADRNYPLNAGAIIDNNRIQGITRSCAYWLNGYGLCPQQNCTDSVLCHADGIQVYGASDLTVTRNRLYHNEVQAIFLDSTAPMISGTIANNMIGDVIGGTAGIAMDGRTIQGTWNIRFNTLATGEIIRVVHVNSLPAGVVFDVRGNAGNWETFPTTDGGSCTSGYPGFMFSYNVWGGQSSSVTGCGSTDINDRPTFVNDQPAPEAAMDLHLVRGSAGIERGDPSQHPPADIEGDMRPLRARPDAGADQRETALLVPGRSIGAVRIGVSRKAVEEFYGRPRKLTNWKPAGSKGRSAGKDGPRIAFYRLHGGSLWVIYQSDVVVGAGTNTPFYSTPAGLGVGAEARLVGGARYVECRHAYRSYRGGVATFYGTPQGRKTATVSSVSILRRSHEYC